MKRWIAVVAVALSGAPALAQNATEDALAATRLKGNRLRLKISTPEQLKDNGTGFEFDVDGDDKDYRPLAGARTFAGSGDVSLEVFELNPLAFQVTTGDTDAEDPNNTALAKALEKLSAFPALLKKDAGDDEAARVDTMLESRCEPLRALAERLETLRNELEVTRGLDEEIAEWRQTAADKPGPSGITDARKAIAQRQAKVAAAVTKANATLDFIRSFVVPDVATPVPTATPTTARAEMASTPTPTATPVGARGISEPRRGSGRPLVANAAAGDAASADAAGVSEACHDLAKTVKNLVAITDVERRIRVLAQLAEALTALHKSLGPYADRGNWEGTSYRIKMLRVSPDKIKTVKVRALPVRLSFKDDQLERSVDEKDPGAAEFRLRRHRSLVTETAAGLVVTPVRRQSYSTRKDPDGTLRIARGPADSIDYTGALLLNLVCRCGLDAAAYPMLQIGAATEKSSPGLLAGLGLRFTGDKCIGISGGAIAAWVKDLQTKREGDVVDGQADIDKDLKLQPTIKGYVAVQITF